MVKQYSKNPFPISFSLILQNFLDVGLFLCNNRLENNYGNQRFLTARLSTKNGLAGIRSTNEDQGEVVNERERTRRDFRPNW